MDGDHRSRRVKTNFQLRFLRHVVQDLPIDMAVVQQRHTFCRRTHSDDPFSFIFELMKEGIEFRLVPPHFFREALQHVEISQLLRLLHRDYLCHALVHRVVAIL